MRFEGQPKPHTPTEILAALDRGDIISGKRLYDVTLEAPYGNIIARVNETEKTITYAHNGVSIEAHFDDENITHFEVTDSITARSISTPIIRQQHQAILNEWHNARQ